jgi:hypothetical protein
LDVVVVVVVLLALLALLVVFAFLEQPAKSAAAAMPRARVAFTVFTGVPPGEFRLSNF